MIRRDFLKYTAAAAFIPQFEGSQNFGWLPSSTPVPGFLNTFPQFEGTGRGKIVLLYKYIEAILKQSLPAHKQTGPDCTSHAAGMTIDLLQAIQVILNKDRWENQIATEILHIGGRKVIGKRNSGGVALDEILEFLQKYGVIYRRKYKDYDFTKYNYNNCPKPTIPNWLLQECKKHKIIKALKINTWDEARDAIRNLHPIFIGSKVGFNNAKRDKDGFAKPSGTWYHAWSLIGIDDRHNRPGGCLMNSHGDNWVKGPRRYNQPKGSIWVDKSVLNSMLSNYGECFALCEFQGSKPKSYNLW